jgi:hypothetical protein
MPKWLTIYFRVRPPAPAANSRELLKHRPLILNPRNGFRSVDVLNGETEGSTYKYCSIGSSPTVT